jgi:hypothetical protein
VQEHPIPKAANSITIYRLGTGKDRTTPKASEVSGRSSKSQTQTQGIVFHLGNRNDPTLTEPQFTPYLIRAYVLLRAGRSWGTTPPAPLPSASCLLCLSDLGLPRPTRLPKRTTRCMPLSPALPFLPVLPFRLSRAASPPA